MIRSIAVLDGQGGGLGKAFIKLIKKELKDITITALATREIGMLNMMNAGADSGLYGEENILRYLKKGSFDCLVGPIGILINGSINGEITEAVAASVFNLKCSKYIIPLKMHGINIAGTSDLELKEIFQMIIYEIKQNAKGL